MPDPLRSLRVRLGLGLVRVACWIAPGTRSKDLRLQWQAELLHRARRPELREPGLVLWSLGAFRHAWYLLRSEYTMDLIWQDAKYGLRSLSRSRGLVAVAVLSLAIGIGANTSIFSAVDVFMLRPLPYPEADRLHAVWLTNQDRGWDRTSFTVPDFRDLRQQSRTMDLAAYHGGTFSLVGDFEAERLPGFAVTPGFFRVLGVAPSVGREFTPEDATPGSSKVAIISFELWQRRFGRDPGLLGSDITLNGSPHTVVGVMPPRFWFRFPGRDVWVPRVVDGTETRDSYFLQVLARVRDGSDRDAALAEARQIIGRISEAYPETSAGHGATMLTLHDDVVDEGFRAGTLISTVGVALVLLIACANVANLLLTHASGREREVALRGALGAARPRIARQFLVEAVLVALAGGVLGLGLAFLGIRGLLSIMPPFFPRTHEIGLSPRVLAYTGAVSLLTALLFGLAPALHAARGNLAPALQQGGRGASGARGGSLRKGLVVTEVALAVVLLVSSVLLVKGFARVRLADLGFDRSDVLTFQTLLPENLYGDTASAEAFYRGLQERILALPGVTAVGAATTLPLQGSSETWYVLGSEDYADASARKTVTFKYVLPEYFESLDIPLQRGRAVEARDRAGSPHVAVVNEAMARLHWPEGDPIGQRIVLGSGPREIVGVVADTWDDGAGSEQRATLFMSAYQSRQLGMDWAVEAGVPLSTLVEPVRAQVRASDPNVPVYDVMSFDDLIEQTLGGDLIMAKIMGALAAIALVLALGGIYGIMAHSVRQRTREMGIRLSLGAQRRDVLSMVVRQGAALSMLGIAIGVGAGLLATRGLSHFLFGVSPFDLATYASVAAALLLAGVVATCFPAVRATRVDPGVTLRTE